MAQCEDFPACGHELGCCPDFDESGRQLNMVCVCGAKLPINNPSSLCDHCLNEGNEEFEPEEPEEREDNFRDDVEADADTLASAGYGTNEDYGDFWGDE